MKIRAVAFVALLLPLAAGAAPDAAEGRKLVQQHKCETCHQDKVYGPPGTIYLRRTARSRAGKSSRRRSRVAARC